MILEGSRYGCKANKLSPLFSSIVAFLWFLDIHHPYPQSQVKSHPKSEGANDDHLQMRILKMWLMIFIIYHVS